jgi:Protein of unknown function, DUF624
MNTVHVPHQPMLFEPAPARASAKVDRQFIDGPLGRAATIIYWFIIVDLLMILLLLPTIALFLLLDRSAGNVPIFAAALVPVGPALTAGISALARRAHDDDITPARAFWRGFRSTALDALQLWVPLLVVVGIVATVLINRQAAGISDVYALVLVAILAVATVIVAHAMVIRTFFSFRFVDALRLGVIFLVRRLPSSLGVLSLIVLAGGVTYFASEFVAILISVMWATLLLRNERPVLRAVADQFVASTHPNPHPETGGTRA